MIDFLKNYGITESVIDKINSVNSDANLYNLSCNQDEIGKIIVFLKELGIDCIDQLLIYRIDMFFASFDKLRVMFDKADIDRVVQLINDDYTMIDQI